MKSVGSSWEGGRVPTDLVCSSTMDCIVLRMSWYWVVLRGYWEERGGEGRGGEGRRGEGRGGEGKVKAVNVTRCQHSFIPILPIFIPDLARALRALAAPGPGVLVLRRAAITYNTIYHTICSSTD